MAISAGRPTGSEFGSYAFAVGACAAAFLFRLEVDRLTGTQTSLTLCGMAAVITCAWRAGIGAAAFAAVLTTIWCVGDSWGAGSGSAGTHSIGFQAWIHCGLYATEAAVICIYGGQLRIARDRAARGEDWRQRLVETSGEGIWMINPEGVIDYANPRMAEILGCAVEEISGRKFEAFFFSEDLPAERIRLQSRRSGVKEQFDRRLRRADGSEVWTLACGTPYTYNQQDAGSLTMMTDITERKKAEQALRRSEQRFRELFENICEGVYQTSPDGRILEANPELLRMLGFSSSEELNLAGVVRDTFVDTDLIQNLRDRLDRDGSYSNIEFQLRTRDHRIITVRENARVVRDENGHVLYYEGSLTEITEKLRVEKQLRQAQQMEALGRLAGGIARDFRGIGTGMLNGLQQAQELLSPDSPAHPRLEAVKRSMQSADALTRQILDFSQRQVRTHDLAAAIDVNALIAGLEPALVRLASPETSLVLSLCTGSTLVHADPGHLEQIVTSFVIHAREYGASVKTIELATTLEAHGPAGAAPTSGPFVSLSVRSRGAADHEQARPWIGMATTQAILAQYGGIMIAEAAPVTVAPENCVGHGIRYALYLPLAGGTLPALTPATVSRPAPEHPDTPAVLLLEEEPLIRELSRDMLERQGFRVLTAGSAAQAERIARGEEPFDVLITAWVTEGGWNDSLAQVLRDMRPGLRVLFVAGYSDENRDSLSAPEGCAILHKPFSGDSLGREIRLLLDKRSAARM